MKQSDKEKSTEKAANETNEEINTKEEKDGNSKDKHTKKEKKDENNNKEDIDQDKKLERDEETEGTEEKENSEENNNSSINIEEADEANYLRLMADFQNYKRRVEKEKSDIHAYANEKIVIKLLEVADNFERALSHEQNEDDKFYQGMKMILTQLNSVMIEFGVEEIKALNADFDPNYHNAVMMEDVEEQKKDKVIEVLQNGYTLKGKVIRPSMVKVGK